MQIRLCLWLRIRVQGNKLVVRTKKMCDCERNVWVTSIKLESIAYCVMLQKHLHTYRYDIWRHVSLFTTMDVNYKLVAFVTVYHFNNTLTIWSVLLKYMSISVRHQIHYVCRCFCNMTQYAILSNFILVTHTFLSQSLI